MRQRGREWQWGQERFPLPRAGSLLHAVFHCDSRPRPWQIFDTQQIGASQGHSPPIFQADARSAGVSGKLSSRNAGDGRSDIQRLSRQERRNDLGNGAATAMIRFAVCDFRTHCRQSGMRRRSERDPSEIRRRTFGNGWQIRRALGDPLSEVTCLELWSLRWDRLPHSSGIPALRRPAK